MNLQLVEQRDKPTRNDEFHHGNISENIVCHTPHQELMLDLSIWTYNPLIAVTKTKLMDLYSKILYLTISMSRFN